jgi:hypothetical protein
MSNTIKCIECGTTFQPLAHDRYAPPVDEWKQQCCSVECINKRQSRGSRGWIITILIFIIFYFTFCNTSTSNNYDEYEYEGRQSRQ